MQLMVKFWLLYSNSLPTNEIQTALKILESLYSTAAIFYCPIVFLLFS